MNLLGPAFDIFGTRGVNIANELGESVDFVTVSDAYAQPAMPSTWICVDDLELFAAVDGEWVPCGDVAHWLADDDRRPS